MAVGNNGKKEEVGFVVFVLVVVVCMCVEYWSSRCCLLEWPRRFVVVVLVNNTNIQWIIFNNK
jgi:hypothetical protein